MYAGVASAALPMLTTKQYRMSCILSFTLLCYALKNHVELRASNDKVGSIDDDSMLKL